MHSPATTFERRFLFSVGRHFWNFIAVCGFVAIATGGTIALHSQLLSEPDRRLLNETISQVPDFEQWMSGNCSSLPPKEGYSKTKHDWTCNNFSFLMREDTQQKIQRNGWDRFCSKRTPDGKVLKASKYVNRVCTGYEWFPFEVISYTDNYRSTHSALAEQAITRKARQIELQLRIAARLGLGGLVSAWGLGVVAIASLYSALLAIERNTRSQESRARAVKPEI